MWEIQIGDDGKGGAKQAAEGDGLFVTQHPGASTVVIHLSTSSKVSPLLSACRSSHGSWRDASMRIESVDGMHQAAVRREAGI
jgi:hypothetical protein